MQISRWQTIQQTIQLIQKIDPKTLPYLILQALVTVAYPYYASTMLAIIVNAFLAGRSWEKLVSLVFLLIVLGALLQIGSQLLEIRIERLKRELVVGFDRLMIEKNMNLDYQQVETPAISDMRVKAENLLFYNDGLNKILKGLFLSSFQMVLSLVITMFTLFAIVQAKTTQHSALADFSNSPGFLLCIVLLLVIPAFFAFAIAKKNSRLELALMDDIVQLNKNANYFLNQVLLDDQSGEIFRAYGATRSFVDWILASFEIKPIRLLMKGQLRITRNVTLVQVFTLGIIGVLYALISLKAYVAAIQIGSILIFVGYLQNFINSLNMNINDWTQGYALMDYLKNLVIFLQVPTEKTKQEAVPIATTAGAGTIQFEAVSFCYPGTTDYILQDVTVTLHPHQKIALVGRNGSGKTTFIKLLCRLYRPTSGRILFNGIDIQELAIEEYRSQLAVVFQDYQLFDYTIAEVIAGAEKADPTKLHAALTASGMDAWVDHLPQKDATYLGTQINENGRKLSGGESQKLAIARAYYKDAPWLILDEPTAALDPQSEFDIYAHFNELTGNKSAIYISHRMSSCRFCDRILVLDQGQITQDGNHKELVADSTQLYAKLYQAQAQYYT